MKLFEVTIRHSDTVEVISPVTAVNVLDQVIVLTYEEDGDIENWGFPHHAIHGWEVKTLKEFH